ncbi:MAG: NAD-dependent epimerase/dehydratase family protein [Cyanobacteria bacterium]|nr:NAD-dependent epimerase/dehydratase family protein [Cyanobacteriota bacterium]
MALLLITGASGFIGRALIESLIARGGNELHAVKWGIPKVPLSDRVCWHECSLLDHGSVDALFSTLKPEVLIQLAWCADHATYWKDPANFDWLSANLNIARAFVRQGGRRAVFAGTSAEYDWSGELPLKEFETLLNPQMLYGSCKLAAYWALKSFFEQDGVSWAWARFFNPFGPYEDRRRLIPKVCLKLLAGEQLDFDAALSQRDFLHVDDVGSALAALALSEVQGPVNLGSGERTLVRDLVSTLARITGHDGLVHFSEAAGESDAIVSDVTRLREEVGWSSSWTLERRLQQTFHWWKQNK